MSDAQGRWGDLGQRMLSGAIFAGGALWVMWIGGLAFHALIAVISGIMVWELCRMIGTARSPIAFGVICGLILFVAVELPGGFALPLLMAPAMLGVGQLDKHRFTYAIFTGGIMLAGFGMIGLRDDFGFGWMAWLALVVIVTDIMGYFAGRLIGGPKFWPKISPKKTWSGTIAGWIGAACVGTIYVIYGQSGWELVGISVAISMAGQMGDVAESSIKRRMGVKDSSSILPGHGGMFDRFDAMLGAAIFLLLVEQLIDFPPAPVPL